MSFFVSVVIPAYNRSGLLTRALDSVRAQTHPAAEVVVVDDGSNDGTGDLVRTRYPQVRLIIQENRGVSAARNRGISESHHPWIAFLDSDDAWLPEKLELQRQELRRNPEPPICHGEEVWVRNGKEVTKKAKYRKRGGWIFPHCLPVCAIAASAAVIHRDALRAVGAFDETYPVCEDYDLWLRLCARYPVACVATPVTVKYDGHGDQLSHRRGLDRYRIRALASILGSGELRKEDALAAAACLKEKCRIYAQGARKHGREKAAREVEALAARY